MSGRDMWGTDNPERVGGEGEAPSDYRATERDVDADYERYRDEEDLEEEVNEAEYKGNRFQEQGCFYRGSLITDCLAAAALQSHSDFCLAHGLPQPKEKE